MKAVSEGSGEEEVVSGGDSCREERAVLSTRALMSTPSLWLLQVVGVLLVLLVMRYTC